MNKNTQTVLAVAITAILVFAVMQYGVPLWKQPSSISYMTFIVDYADGTSHTYDSRSQAVGQTIIESSTGKTVTAVHTNLNIIPTFTGTIQSYTVTGSLAATIHDLSAGDIIVYNSGSVTLSPVSPLPSLTSGSSSIICSSTLSASSLQSLYSSWKVNNGYALYDTFSNVKVTITFADGAQLSQTVASGSNSWQFTYQSSSTFTSLSVTFSFSASY